jgi:hypothetical protein
LANKYKGEVSFEAGEETFILRFGANAVVGIEEAFAKTIRQIGEQMMEPGALSMADVKKMFCIGLADHYAETRPEIDEQKAKFIFARLGPIEATQVVVKAMNAAFDAGGQAAPAANPPPPADQTTGTGSGS